MYRDAIDNWIKFVLTIIMLAVAGLSLLHKSRCPDCELPRDLAIALIILYLVPLVLLVLRSWLEIHPFILKLHASSMVLLRKDEGSKAN